jgi:hypothetical protein
VPEQETDGPPEQSAVQVANWETVAGSSLLGAASGSTVGSEPGPPQLNSERLKNATNTRERFM